MCRWETAQYHLISQCNFTPYCIVVILLLYIYYMLLTQLVVWFCVRSLFWSVMIFVSFLVKDWFAEKEKAFCFTLIVLCCVCLYFVFLPNNALERSAFCISWSYSLANKGYDKSENLHRLAIIMNARLCNVWENINVSSQHSIWAVTCDF